MRIVTKILIIKLICISFIFGQIAHRCDKIEYKPTAPKPSLNDMLSGVKYALIKQLPRINGQVPAFQALAEYLNNMGFEIVEFETDDYEPPLHSCEYIDVQISFDYDFYKFYNVKLYFQSPCNTEYVWVLSSDKIARAGLDDNAKLNFYKVLHSMYPHKKPNFNKLYRLELPKMETCWTEELAKLHFSQNGFDDLEGIYESMANSNTSAKYRVIVKKINGGYVLIYISGAMNEEDWKEGEIKATLHPTATPLLYKATWIMAHKSQNDNYYLNFTRGFFSLVSEEGNDTYVKMFPTQENTSGNSQSLKGSGTGYAISSAGHIVTNHHVVKGANSIKVKGVKGDFHKVYSAKLVVEDKNNDLAIIKIEDNNFNSIGIIPYTISSRSSDVGTSVFVLGYPLRASMGDEVKITNGIISSKSGYQGDVTSYQISAPIQPGNSGGPLFDDKGNIIGTINAKHLGAENASYAIKSSYLLNLIDLMPTTPQLSTTSTLLGKPLAEQIKIIKNYVYVIEAH